MALVLSIQQFTAQGGEAGHPQNEGPLGNVKGPSIV